MQIGMMYAKISDLKRDRPDTRRECSAIKKVLR
jgi:hypothetical protein